MKKEPSSLRDAAYLTSTRRCALVVPLATRCVSCGSLFPPLTHAQMLCKSCWLRVAFRSIDAGARGQR